MWNEKQALAAQWKVNLQALASCDWENGQEFDLSLEEADERFVRLNELIRAYMQAKKNQKAAEDTAETAQEWYSQLCAAVTKAKQEYAGRRSNCTGDIRFLLKRTGDERRREQLI